MRVKNGGGEIDHMMWVADISDDTILGLDFMREHTSAN